jgi:hypothetical protein
MARELKSVKITAGSLDETPLRGGTTILRGVIDPESLKHLQFDDYQREALPLSSLRKLTTAIQAGEVLPDIEIGMRGDRVHGGKDTFYLQDDCYVIDGQQRVNACCNTLLQGGTVHLGAVIHFNTTKEWERDRFRILNSDRIKVSPNILIRNIRTEHPSIQTLYAMTDAANTGFCLAGRVCWSQKMNRGELITAMTMVKTLGCLHTHIAPGRASAFGDIAVQLDTIADKITLGMMKDNFRTFFDLVDQAWGVRTVKYKELSRHLSSNFLWTVARVLSNHTDFWKNAVDGRLFIDADLKRKFGSFPLSDPGISQLMAAGGTAGNLLYDHLVHHLNSGRRTNRLKVRPTADLSPAEAATEAA